MRNDLNGRSAPHTARRHLKVNNAVRSAEISSDVE
jgi:hypothetical protein